MLPELNSRFSNARILVVDDSIFSRRLISTALEKVGFHNIDTATDGADALAKVYDFCPDLVILDLNMPNLDGFGFCERVRSDPSLPHMPIIVQTEVEEREARLHALSCGADDFLRKPLDMDELRLRICVHVERHLAMIDMKDVCDCLRMELDELRGLRDAMEQADPIERGASLLENHCDVMKQLITVACI
jgi:DNA-binding response OmpR family regulator